MAGNALEIGCHDRGGKPAKGDMSRGGALLLRGSPGFGGKSPSLLNLLQKKFPTKRKCLVSVEERDVEKSYEFPSRALFTRSLDEEVKTGRRAGKRGGGQFGSQLREFVFVEGGLVYSG